MTADLSALGVAETRLDDATISSLPPNTAPEPWIGGGHGIVWGKRIDSTALGPIRAAVPEVIGAGATPIAVGGFLVVWDDTPVGAYWEIGAMIVLRRRASVFGHVPFIAVDSPASLVGGRDNWAIPKTLASFTGNPGRDERADLKGPGFVIETRQQSSRIVLPTFSPRAFPLVQARPDGSTITTRPVVTGLVRPARIDVTIDADSELSAWFPTGRCNGVVAPRLGMRTGIGKRRPNS